MARFVSPGVFIIEKDLSEYPASINPSIVGIVGFSEKGPVNVATLITSQEQLVKTFGRPAENTYGQGLEGAIEILEATNTLYFVRAITSSGADASASVALGACPAIQVSSNGYGVSNPLHLLVQVTNNLGANQFTIARQFDIPSGTVGLGESQGLALQKVLGGSLDDNKIGAFTSANSDPSGWIAGAFAGSASVLSVSAFSDTALTAAVAALAVLDLSGNATADPATTATVTGMELRSGSTDGVAYLVESLFNGGGYNAGLKTDGTTSGNSIEVIPLGGANNYIQVNDSGAAEETFKVSLVASGIFIEDVINTGETINLTSQIVKGNLVQNELTVTTTALSSLENNLNDLGFTVGTIGTGLGSTNVQVNPRFVKLVQGTYDMAGGDNGDPGAGSEANNALIGDGTVDPKTGMQSFDDETLNISIALVPGITDQSVQNALITLAEDTQNFLALVAPPFAIGTTQDAIDWHNGQSETRTAALNSSYAAIYWPWALVFSNFDAKDVWLDPTIFAARQMAYTDEVAEAWFAPAGFVRGRLTKPTDLEIRLNQGDRDSLYSGGNAINPLVNFPQQGITIFGQRTTQRATTALDRVNVRRLMIVLRKQILASTTQFVFEPNDAVTWARVVSVIEPLVDDIKRRRGITEFKVVCDETTNTPVRVDRNELWCKVLIKPTKTAEIVVFELNLTNQSAKIS